jgi:hypothetical protein
MGLDTAYPGRPRIGRELSELVVRIAKENPGWGYDWIMGALFQRGQKLSDQTVGNILRQHGIPPARKRRGTRLEGFHHVAYGCVLPTSSRSKC